MFLVEGRVVDGIRMMVLEVEGHHVWKESDSWESGKFVESTGGVVQPFKPSGPCHGSMWSEIKVRSDFQFLSYPFILVEGSLTGARCVCLCSQQSLCRV